MFWKMGVIQMFSTSLTVKVFSKENGQDLSLA